MFTWNLVLKKMVLMDWRMINKRLKFGYADKWYIKKAGSVKEKKKYIIHCDFEIETDHLIQARRPDLGIINEKRRISHQVDFVVLTDHRVKIKENEKIDKSWILPENCRSCGR